MLKLTHWHKATKNWKNLKYNLATYGIYEFEGFLSMDYVNK